MPPFGVSECSSNSFGLTGFYVDERVPQLKFVTLEELSASVKIYGFVSHLTVSLSYKNTCDRPLEVCYRCPVDAKAAVYSFEAHLDNRTIKARCMEKKKAKQVYDAAVRQGHTAVFAAEDDTVSDIFYMRLGNLPAGEKADLVLSMVSELPVETDGAISYVLPTVFTPRYGSSPTPGTTSQPATNDITIVTESSYAMKIEAEVSGSKRIEKIVSHTDQIEVLIDEDGTGAKINQDGPYVQDHDWSMRCYYHSPYTPQAFRCKGDRSGVSLMKDDILMLNFFPELPIDAYSPHNEIIFMVDRSGSMQGERIAFAKSSLLMFLKSLPHGCRFNIVSFGSSHNKLFPGSSERYSEKTLAKALSLQKSMWANMGGTEIYQALQAVYGTPPVQGYTRQILLLTDGSVWDTSRIIDLVKRHQNECRVFTLGIGTGASTALVRGVAEAGRGRCELELHAADMQPKVMGMLASMLQESVTDVRIKCHTLSETSTVTFIPKIQPVIFGGQHLITYARIEPGIEVTSVEIEGIVGERPLKFTLSADHIRIVHDEQFGLHRLAASAQIKQWQIEEDPLSENSTKSIISLSEATDVISKHTGFVGVDQDNRVQDNDYNQPNMSEDILGAMCLKDFDLSRCSSLSFKKKAPTRSFFRPGFANPFHFGSSSMKMNLSDTSGRMGRNVSVPVEAYESKLSESSSASFAPSKGFSFGGLFGATKAAAQSTFGGLFGQSHPPPPPPSTSTGNKAECPTSSFSFGGSVSEVNGEFKESEQSPEQTKSDESKLIDVSLPKRENSFGPSDSASLSGGFGFATPSSGFPQTMPGHFASHSSSGLFGTTTQSSSELTSTTAEVLTTGSKSLEASSGFGSSSDMAPNAFGFKMPPPSVPITQPSCSSGSITQPSSVVFGNATLKSSETPFSGGFKLTKQPSSSECTSTTNVSFGGFGCQTQPTSTDTILSSSEGKVFGSTGSSSNVFGSTGSSSNVFGSTGPSSNVFGSTVSSNLFGSTRTSSGLGWEGKNNEDILLKIMTHQQFNGGWKLDDVKNIVNIDDKIWEELKTLSKELNLDSVAVATSFILTFLKLRCSGREQEWKLIAVKAKAFLLQNYAVSADHEIWAQLNGMLQ